MVTVKCNRHGQHVMKPLDCAVLLDWAIDSLSTVAYQDALPEVAGVSEKHLLAQALCPAEELRRLKEGESASNLL